MGALGAAAAALEPVVVMSRISGPRRIRPTAVLIGAPRG
jgi:hypothetical protein